MITGFLQFVLNAEKNPELSSGAFLCAENGSIKGKSILLPTILASQQGLCPEELLGASGRLRRGPSLGDLTSAGARNSQVTL